MYHKTMFVYCCLIIFANMLDPDQARHLVGPDLDPNCDFFSTFMKITVGGLIKKKSGLKAYVLKFQKLFSFCSEIKGGVSRQKFTKCLSE